MFAYYIESLETKPVNCVEKVRIKTKEQKLLNICIKWWSFVFYLYPFWVFMVDVVLE